jgi:alpha-methylacyl-CoA racemase
LPDPEGKGGAGRAGPLSALRVVELPGLAPVPFAAMLLADLGADVVRIRRPPDRPGDQPATSGGGRGALNVPDGPMHRSRPAVVLDLKQPGDVAALLALAERADVLLEGFRPGVTERLGIGPDECLARNPRLVYVRLTGWGQQGPLSTAVGHDVTYLALSGVLGTLGPAQAPPTVPVNYLADFAGGAMTAVIGVLAALLERAGSGRGQVVDAAMVDGAALLTVGVLGLRAAGMWQGPRGHNLLDGGAPFYTTYQTADGGHLAVGALEPDYYAAFLAGLGLAADDLPDQQDPFGWPTLRRRFAEVIITRTRTEWEQVFAGTSACVAPVLTPWEAAEHPHAQARGAYLDLDGVRQPAPAPRFDRTPPPVPGPVTTSEVEAVLDRWRSS